MNAQDNPHKSPAGGVTLLPDPIWAMAQQMIDSGLSPAEFARVKGMNHGMAYWLARNIEAGRLKWSQKLAGPEWAAIFLAFKHQGQEYPEYVISPYPPRQCDVTDRWFIPSDPRQRFYPGLSEAVKRAARRNLRTARQKFATLGDWGQE